MLVRAWPVSLLALAAAALTCAYPARAADGRIIGDDVALTLGADGALRAVETVTFEGPELRRVFVVRRHLDDSRDRRFEVTGVRGGVVHGDGDDRTAVTLRGGPGRTTARLAYTVKGTITPLRNGEELNWIAAGGWEVPAELTRVTVDSGTAVQNLNCFAGDPGSTIGCTQFFTNHTHTRAEFQQQNLQPGEYLTIVIGYPPGSTRATPILRRRHTLTTAFTVNTATGGTLIGLLVLLLGGVAALYTTRGRDTRVVSKKAAEGDHPPVEGTAFAPPDGVRPGQVGTLIDEQADVVDVTATIVDLAVRGYLLIEELPRETYGRLDWRLRKLKRDTSDLLPYERLLHDALFHQRDAVKLSELGGTFAEQLAAVRGALYEDVVRQGWFARRPDSERTRWTTAGMAIAAAGLLGTVALALFTELALIGLAVIIAGAALAVGGQYMPAKTGRGAVVLAHTLGFRAHMFREKRPDAPAEDRIRLFSRHLPYAVVFDAVPHWAQTVADVGDGEPTDHLYWYEGLRSPLAILRTRLELTDPDYPALTDVARLETLTADLLLLARLDAGERLRLQEVDFAQVTAEEAAQRRPRSDVRINLRVAEDILVHGSGDQLRRLVANLVDNAARHAATTVTVRLTAEDGLAVLDVTDDGPGIPAPFRETVFDRFTRLDQARDRDHGGSGLGLAIARDIAAAHGGTLTVVPSDSGAHLRSRLPTCTDVEDQSDGPRRMSSASDGASTGCSLSATAERSTRA